MSSKPFVRLHELLDEFGQLASSARAMSRDDAIHWFSELASRTAFRPADDDAVVTISAALADPVVLYDGIWVAGLHAEAFPQPVQPDPFLPLPVQIAAGIPAASAGGRLAEAARSARGVACRHRGVGVEHAGTLGGFGVAAQSAVGGMVDRYARVAAAAWTHLAPTAHPPPQHARVLRRRSGSPVADRPNPPRRHPQPRAPKPVRVSRIHGAPAR